MQGADRDITRRYIFRLCTLIEGPWSLGGNFGHVFVLPTARADRLSLFLGTKVVLLRPLARWERHHWNQTKKEATHIMGRLDFPSVA